MIFELKDGLRRLPEVGIDILSKNILRLVEKGHFLTMDLQLARWLEKTLTADYTYYSKNDIDFFRESFMRCEPTGELRSNLGPSIIIDTLEDVVEMKDMLDQSSAVYMENKLHDWSVVTKWAELYGTGRNKSATIEYLGDAISSGWVKAEHAGGKGSIAPLVENDLATMGAHRCRRICALFDSDRDFPDHVVDENEKIKRKLAELGVSFHELEKREMENYFPYSTYHKAGITKGDRPKTLSEKDWDFLDLSKCDFLDYEKKQLPDVALHLTLNEAKDRLRHIGRNPDEITEILLKIARIV